MGCAPHNTGWLWLGCGTCNGGFGPAVVNWRGCPDASPCYWELLCSTQTFSPGSHLTLHLAQFNGMDGMQWAFFSPPAGAPWGIFNLHWAKIQPESAPKLTVPCHGGWRAAPVSLQHLCRSHMEDSSHRHVPAANQNCRHMLWFGDALTEKVLSFQEVGKMLPLCSSVCSKCNVRG